MATHADRRGRGHGCLSERRYAAVIGPGALRRGHARRSPSEVGRGPGRGPASLSSPAGAFGAMEAASRGAQSRPGGTVVGRAARYGSHGGQPVFRRDRRHRARPRAQPRRRGLGRRGRGGRRRMGHAVGDRARRACSGGPWCCSPAGGWSTQPGMPSEVSICAETAAEAVALAVRLAHSKPDSRPLQVEERFNNLVAADTASDARRCLARCAAGSLARSPGSSPLLIAARRTPAGAAVPPDPIEQPGKQTPPASQRAAPIHSPLARQPASDPHHLQRLAAVATDSSSRALVRFQVARPRAGRVRVRLAFVSLADRHHLPRQPRRTPHRPHRTYSCQAITSRPGATGCASPRATRAGSKAVRSTTVQSRPRPRPRSRGRRTRNLPGRGSVLLGRQGRPVRRAPATATSTRARTSPPRRARRWSRPRPARSTGAPTRPAAPATTWCSTPTARTSTTSTCTCSQGSLLVSQGRPRRRRAAHRERRQHRQLGGPAPPLRGLGRPLVRRRPPGRPVPVPEVLGAAS